MTQPRNKVGSAAEAHEPAASATLDPSARASIQVLVVDDERSLRDSCTALLRGTGFSVTACGRGDDAQRMLRNRSFDMLLADLFMPRVSGLELLATGLEANPDLVAIMMTGDPSVESSVAALRAGAWDYLPKPFSATHFEILVGRAAHSVLSSRERVRAASVVSREGADGASGSGLCGASRALQRVVELADRVARTDASVFITGESGTGKELVAKYIHANSRRSGRELVAVNCAAIPEALLESEMFGHVEGAFTGAVRSKEGLLEAADGGTLFLDELTEMPMLTQAKLLRVLQDGMVRRVGSTRTDAVVDVRFIAATNRDPSEAVESGELRRDLHYRLRVVPIHIPPLRERPEDIPILAEEFLREFWAQHRGNGEQRPRFSESAMGALRRARWPGNVRELRNVVEHAVVLADSGREIEADDVVFLDADAGTPGLKGPSLSDFRELDYHSAREQVLSGFEVEYLTQIVRESKGNISDAARMAGVDRTTLYRLMEKHGLERDSIAVG